MLLSTITKAGASQAGNLLKKQKRRFL